jgi:hypothetical protein
MLATHADPDVLEAPPAEPETRSSAPADPLAELEDEMSSARGLLHGMSLGLLSLSIVGVAVWWAF